MWCVGFDVIPEVDSYTHLGVLLDRNLSIAGCLKEANAKIKRTLLSLDCCGVYENGGLNPLTSKKIYKSVVLPKGLYGCEMWYDMTQSDILFNERTHRFCVKYMQSIGTRTRTHIALGLLGLYSVEAEIDKKKLILFGQLCRLELYSCIKEVFLFRLCSYFNNNQNQKGYFKDIFCVLIKYNLVDTVRTYVNSGQFPSKSEWKIQINKRIKQHEELLWYTNNTIDEFRIFNLTQPTLKESCIWLIGKRIPKLLKSCRVVIKMVSYMCSYSTEKLCSKCGILYNDVIKHTLFDCSVLENHRISFSLLLNTELGHEVSDYVSSLNSYEQLGVLLGGPCTRLEALSKKEYDTFLELSIVFLSKLWQLKDTC